MTESSVDLRPENLEEYKKQARFLKEAKDGGPKYAEEYHNRLHERVFNKIFSKDSLVALKEDKAVIDSDAIRETLEGMRDNAKIHRSVTDTPIYRIKKRSDRRAFRDAYNWVRGKDRPHKWIQKGFGVPDQVKKEEFTPDEVKKVLEEGRSESEIKAFKERESTGIISDKDLLYFGSPDQLGGALFTALVTQRSIVFNRSLSSKTIMAGIIAGAYTSKSAAKTKRAYDEGLKKGIADELHELGTWMKMDELGGKKIQIETGNVPEPEQVRLGGEPYFEY